MCISIELVVFAWSSWWHYSVLEVQCWQRTSLSIQHIHTHMYIYVYIHMHICMQYVAVHCSVLHYIAFCWSVLRCVAVSQFWPGVLFCFIKTESMEDSMIHYARSVGPRGSIAWFFKTRGNAHTDQKTGLQSLGIFSENFLLPCC